MLKLLAPRHPEQPLYKGVVVFLWPFELLMRVKYPFRGEEVLH